MTTRNGKTVGLKLVELLLIPAAFYLFVFFLFTYPLLLRFSTHFFTDTGDGLQNVWNLWWVNKAITQLHQSPLHTNYLHYPYGTSLLGHTLNPFNGLLAIPLLRFFTLVQTHNLIVIFSFVSAGVTAFLLCYYLTRSYPASLVGGFIFTFSNYHFAHAEGHLQLVSMEWIPLFVLCCYLFLERPGIPLGIAGGLVLLAILMCDYYYFFYSVVVACFLFAWQAIRTRKPLFFATRPYRAPFAALAATALATAGPWIWSLFRLNATDPLVGGHPAADLSLDLLALFIPGGHWRFANLTRGYWSSLPGSIHESSVYIGLSVTALLIYAVARRRALDRSALLLWFSVLLFFAVFSLGPVLHVWGREVTTITMPYGWVERLIPAIDISGVPVRMTVMVVLSAAVISAMVLKLLLHSSRPARVAALLLLGIMVVEYLPSPIPTTRIATPPFVEALSRLPADQAILDTVDDPSLALYFQTIHQHPMALGYIARLPKSVADRDNGIYVAKDSGNYAMLPRDYNIRYLVTKATDEAAARMSWAKLVYQDSTVRIYDLRPQ